MVHTTHVTSQNSVETTANLRRSFSVALEALVVTIVAVLVDPIDFLGREGRDGRAEGVGVLARNREGQPWLVGIVAANLVSGGVVEDNILPGTSCDGDIVLWVTPASNAVLWVIVEEVTVLKVRGI